MPTFETPNDKMINAYQQARAMEQHHDRIEEMGKQARTMPQPQAAQMIVDICYEEAAKRKKP